MPRVETLPEDAPRLDLSRRDEHPKVFAGKLISYIRKWLNLAPTEALNPGEDFRNNAANHLLKQGALAEAGPNKTTIVIFWPGADDHEEPVQKKVLIESSNGKHRLYPYSERTIFLLEDPEKIGIAHNDPSKGDVYPDSIPVVLASVEKKAR